MDFNTIKDTIIKKKLAEVFGDNMGTLILNMGVAQSNKGSNDKEKVDLLVDFICSNPKIIAVWGAAEAGKIKQQWKALAK
jgi:hypothetical protein